MSQIRGLSKKYPFFGIKNTTQRISQILFNLLRNTPLASAPTFQSASATLETPLELLLWNAPELRRRFHRDP